MAGIRDVAKKAKVSISTVSLVLNQNGYVSKETREKVTRAMEELHYVPNELARNLYRNRSNIVGIILPDMEHPFFAAFAKYAEMELYHRGFKTMLCSTFREENGEKEYIDMLKRQMMDGIIMGAHSLETDVYQGVKKPIVCLDRFINEDIPVVASDHAKGGRIAALELINSGCREVVQLIGDSWYYPEVVKTPSHERHVVFEQVMIENHVKVHSYQVPWNVWDFVSYEKMAWHIFEKYPEVDGIFGVDIFIVSILREALRRKIRVPQKLKAVSYDGTFLTRVGAFHITSVKQDIEKLAQVSVEVLTDWINGKETNEKRFTIDLEMIKGETT